LDNACHVEQNLKKLDKIVRNLNGKKHKSFMEMLQRVELDGLKGDEYEFFFDFLLLMYFLIIIANMFQNFDFTFVECCVGTNNKETKGCPTKIYIMKDVNDDELVLN
jgi:hypothetical protein